MSLSLSLSLSLSPSLSLSHQSLSLSLSLSHLLSKWSYSLSLSLLPVKNIISIIYKISDIYIDIGYLKSLQLAIYINLQYVPWYLFDSSS